MMALVVFRVGYFLRLVFSFQLVFGVSLLIFQFYSRFRQCYVQCFFGFDFENFLFLVLDFNQLIWRKREMDVEGDLLNFFVFVFSCSFGFWQMDKFEFQVYFSRVQCRLRGFYFVLIFMVCFFVVMRSFWRKLVIFVWVCGRVAYSFVFYINFIVLFQCCFLCFRFDFWFFKVECFRRGFLFFLEYNSKGRFY